MERLGVWSVLAISWVLGLVMSQTTLGPAVTISTAAVNLSTILPSTTGPTCSVLNTSTCAACAPGSYYDNGIDPAMLMLSRCWPVCVSGSLSALSARVLSASGWTTNLPSLLLWILQQVSLLCLSSLVSPEVLCARLVLQEPTAITVAQSPADPALLVSTHLHKTQRHVIHVHKAHSATPRAVRSVGSVLQVQKLSGLPLKNVHPAVQVQLIISNTSCSYIIRMHKPSLQSMCQICSSGFYQIRWGQENCDICPENHYCPSPDVTPIQCPVDAFCPEGSLAPSYCMETFFRKAGETCELAPVTIALLVIGGGVGLLFIIVLVLRRKRDNDSELSMSRTPLLRKDRPPNRFYGIGCDAEPVYAGW
ncbi:hypothetical protein DNTS_014411 [Danionella cerebrum]|uniref:TNFR-Cys domain-containing protein n=1 Tax=Danionella cerebrum TaxID=2873325 RepID=A0A553MXG4_9TELE|nr:hypothetical protein DNTS_014411 [Danionella translucida]